MRLRFTACASTIRSSGHAPASTRTACLPPLGGEHTGPHLTDGGKLGCTHHLIVDQRGLPWVAQLSAANVHDSRLLRPLVQALPSVRGLSGRPRTSDRPNCTPTRATTIRFIASGCASAASAHALHAGAWTAASAWDAGAGWSNECWAGFIASGARASTMNDAPTSTRASSPYPAPSSACASWRDSVRRSSPRGARSPLSPALVRAGCAVVIVPRSLQNRGRFTPRIFNHISRTGER